MPQAIVAHDMPGRTRFRIVERRYDVTYFSEAAKAFATLDGVLSVTARPETASVLIHHRLSLDGLADFARQYSIFTLGVSRADDEVNGDSWDRKLSALAGIKITDLQTPTAIALVAIAAFQATRGNVFGPAASHLLHAFELMLRKHP